ncbi:hypothetical protein RHMOL_Rhmol03G0145100 [Rhododendron molle]|uniref:Uncharacterized protein n=1 Tax=Rhododendron molle TaxID=49168 RepID=A0ACC0PEM6_RHOML|nr:hypothetical protein RHMOL_Rhmol03G0145100 [Rhododendron molle]
MERERGEEEKKKKKKKKKKSSGVCHCSPPFTSNLASSPSPVPEFCSCGGGSGGCGVIFACGGGAVILVTVGGRRGGIRRGNLVQFLGAVNGNDAVPSPSSSSSPWQAFLVHLLSGLGLASALGVAHKFYSANLVSNPLHTLRLIWVIEAPIVVLIYSMFRSNPKQCSYWKAVGRGILGLPVEGYLCDYLHFLVFFQEYLVKTVVLMTVVGKQQRELHFDEWVTLHR